MKGSVSLILSSFGNAAHFASYPAWFPANAADARSTCGRTEPRETVPARSRMLKRSPYWPPIQPPAFVRAALKKSSTIEWKFEALFVTSQKNIYKLSLLEQITGNCNSLMARENSLFFLNPMVENGD